MANLNDIKLSAQDVLKKQFRSKVKGYDPDEVDAYLDQIISDYETFHQIIEDLYGQIGTLQRQLMDEKKKLKKLKSQILKNLLRNQKRKKISRHIHQLNVESQLSVLIMKAQVKFLLIWQLFNAFQL